jgi:hypothetical protein
VAALEIFKRVIGDYVIADGSQKITPTYSSTGKANLTHTESNAGWFTGNPGINDKRRL